MARSRKKTPEEFMEMLINKQFEINGYTDVSYKSLVDNKEAEDSMPFGEAWYQRYTTTEDKEEEFRIYLTEEFKKYYKIRGKSLDVQVSMFLLGYGLMRSDIPKYKNKEE